MSKPDHKRHVGPWLRRYSATPPSRRDRIVPVVLAGGAWIVFVVLVILLFRAFARYPFHVFGGLVGVWVIGFVVLTVKQRRAAARDQAAREGRAIDGFTRR